MIQTGLDWLNARREENRAVAIAYYRASSSVAIATATHEHKTRRYQDDYGLWMREELDDFLVAAEDLVINSVTIEPRVGDEIRRTINGTTHKYEVQRPNRDETCYRFSDLDRKYLRIHTRKVGTA